MKTLVVAIVLAHALLFTGARSEDLVAPRFTDLNLITDWATDPITSTRMNGNNATTNTAAHGGLKHKSGQTTARACTNNGQFFFNGACTAPTNGGDLAPNPPTTSQENVMTFTFPNTEITAGSFKILQFDGWRGSDMVITFTNPDPNVRIRVLERVYPAKTSSYVFGDPTQPSGTAAGDVEYFYRHTVPLRYRTIGGASMDYWIQLCYFGTPGTAPTIDLSTLTITLQCAVSPDENSAFSLVSKNCMQIGCVFNGGLFGYHFFPDANDANTGTCWWYSWSNTRTVINTNQNGPNPGMFTFSGQGANPATLSIPAFSIRQIYFGTFQSEVFTIAASQAAAGTNFGFLICQLGSAYATFHGQKELFPPFEATTFYTDVDLPHTAPVSGTWVVLVANWSPTTAVFDPSILAGNFKCKNNQHYEGPYTHVGGLYNGLDYMKCSAPPLEEDVCSYNTLGFNPWERWNIFASGNSEYLNPTVEGRVASGGQLKITDAAQIHTVNEAYKLPKSAKWSVQAGEVIVEGSGVNAVVHNGGVESAAATTIAADKVDGEIKQDEALSVDLSLAKRYFARRSMEWSERENSVVDHSLAPNEQGHLTLTLRLHGKVNFFKITAEEYSSIRVILLTGHAVGTVIINVSGDTQIPVRSDPLEVLYQNAVGGSEPPTFGRVLLNFYEQGTYEFDLGYLQGDSRKAATQKSSEEDYAVFVSILAPFASLKYKTHQLRGNLIAYNLIVRQGTIKSKPFGTYPQSLNPKQPRAPKEWTATGKHAIACLWHQL